MRAGGGVMARWMDGWMKVAEGVVKKEGGGSRIEGGWGRWRRCFNGQQGGRLRQDQMG